MANHDSFWRLGEQLRLQANLRGNDSGNGNSRFIMDKFNMPNLSNLSLEEQPSPKFNKAEFKKNSYDKQPTASSRSKFKNKHTYAHTPNNGDWNFGEGVQKPAQNNNNDKRFKSLPPSESLPRNETLGGYIFVCNNDTMQDDLKSLLFGLPQRYRDSVRAITPGLPLFLYNYTTHQLHGIFEAASFGGTNIDPTAWEDKKCPGESRFPAQVRIRTRKLCKPLEEDAFRPVLHHYDGPKFRLQLNVPETLALLDICNENGPP